MIESGLWMPDRGLPDGARARDWLREQRIREQYRWRNIRDERVDRLIDVAAPTRVSYTETTAWNTGATTKSTISISWLTGDILAVIAGAESNNTTLGTPTATGLTFTKNKNIAAVNQCPAFCATAVAAGNGSSAVTVTSSSATPHYGFGVWVWRSSTGVGNSASQATTAKTVSLTPTGVNSAMCWGIFDFGADGALTGTPTPTNTDESQDDGTNWSIGVFDLIDQPSAGAVLYGGVTAGVTGPFSIVVQEIKNDGGAVAFLASRQRFPGQAVNRAGTY